MIKLENNWRNTIFKIFEEYNKLLKKYQNKYQNKELERKVIESLLLKGYNYKSVKAMIEGADKND